MKILIVEEDLTLLNTIRIFLRRERFDVEVVSDYDNAIRKLLSYNFDCVIANFNSTDRLFDSFVKQLFVYKMLSKTIVTVFAQDTSKIRKSEYYSGFAYSLTKPIQISELLAQVKTICRLDEGTFNPIIAHKNIQLNTSTRYVLVDNMELKLNKKEFELLQYFMSRLERINDKFLIAKDVWGIELDPEDDFSFMYSQIKNLKKKLKDAKSFADLKTIYGVGYKFN